MANVETRTMGAHGELRVVEHGESLAQAAAELVAETLAAAVAARGRAAVALSGGSTPKRMGELLAEEPLRGRVPWGQLDIFWGDERTVPLDSDESNAGVAGRTFLDAVPVDPARVHPWETGIDPYESAVHYENLIRAIVPVEDDYPRFDLILLGMGDDGHTASLFPRTPALRETTRWAVANPVEKLGTMRLTLTAPAINHAATIVFLVGGHGKAERLAEVLEGPTDLERLPSQSISPQNGRLIWLVDRAAAAKLNGARG